MASAALPGPQPAGMSRDLVFISYSHRDRDWLERLRTLLKPYERQNLKIWADRSIEVGNDWRDDISEALAHACVAVLLVSPDFLASDFIYDEELPPLLRLWEERSITIIPILISACSYEVTPLERIQFAHSTSKPLDEIPEKPENERNSVLVGIVKRIAEAAQKVAPYVPPPPKRVPQRMAAPIAATGGVAALHGVPGQRPNYLRRQEDLDRLKQAVLGATARAIGITGATPRGDRIGLHGMGGIGKTVLAIDLVNDDEVRRLFPTEYSG
jgi:hypothetical protein